MRSEQQVFRAGARHTPSKQKASDSEPGLLIVGAIKHVKKEAAKLHVTEVVSETSGFVGIECLGLHIMERMVQTRYNILDQGQAALHELITSSRIEKLKRVELRAVDKVGLILPIHVLAGEGKEVVHGLGAALVADKKEGRQDHDLELLGPLKRASTRVGRNDNLFIV